MSSIFDRDHRLKVFCYFINGFNISLGNWFADVIISYSILCIPNSYVGGIIIKAAGRILNWVYMLAQ